MNNCHDIRSQLLELCPTATLSEDLQKHMAQCAACSSFHQDLLAINQSGQSLPEHDVSDEVFKQTLDAIQGAQSTAKTKQRINPQWATGLAASFVLFAITGLIYNGSISEFDAEFYQAPYQLEAEPSQDEGRNRQQPAESNSAIEEDEGTVVDVVDMKDLDIDYSVQHRVMSVNSPQKPAPAVQNTLGEIMADQPLSAPMVTEYGAKNEALLDAKVMADQMMQDGAFDDMGEQDRFSDQMAEITVTGSRIKRSDLSGATPIVVLERESNFTEPGAEAQAKLNNTELTKAKSKMDKTTAREITDEFVEKKSSVLVFDNMPEEKPKRQASKDGLLSTEERSESIPVDEYSGKRSGYKSVLNNEPALQYLADLAATENLNFKNATGYWANTYLPGDPNMRWLQAQLQQEAGFDLPGVFQNVQPFDFPNNAALGLYVNSDRKTLEESGPTRMRLQVGIQAGQQKGGQRAALNMAVVLDLDQQNQGARYKAEAKSLLHALLKSKQAADQVSVYLVGTGGGQLLAAADFRHGSIQVVLDELFKQQTDTDSTYVDLQQTLVSANQWLKSADDPNAVLGSSSVLLVSARNEFTETADLESLVQGNAIDGITLSTVSLAGMAQQAQLERLALMGQGHSRVLAGVQDAERLINEELLVSSRAVARALRLQIKLAEGVQLIDVLGSDSLDEAQAQKVRDAEQSLDQRMSKNLGITADRGQDDDGIQMVIPSYFAGDTHVILLDVLVHNKGPIVDVSAKYKDLIYLRNATSQQNLHMSTGKNVLGPLELNVMKNVLAQRLSHTIKLASQALYAGDFDTAVTKLNYILKLYQAIRQHMPVWKNDAEMIQDETIIKQYLQLLNTQSSLDPKQHQLIADAMSFMSWRKLISHSP